MVLHRDDPQDFCGDLVDHGMVEPLKLHPACIPSRGSAQLREVQQQLDESLNLFGEGVTQAGRLSAMAARKSELASDEKQSRN